MIGVALRISSPGGVEGYAIEGTMTTEAIVNLIGGSSLQDLQIRVAQSGERARLGIAIPLGADGIVGTLVMILELRHVIKTINDIGTHPGASRRGMVVMIMRVRVAGAGSEVAISAFKLDRIDERMGEVASP